MSVPNIQVFGKPIEKLIETVSKGIGVVYKPKAIRNEAEAEAYKIEKIAEAKAKASIIKADAENEIAERARQRLYHQEMSRQLNIDSIIDKTALLLNETVSEKPVDDDWRNRFFSQAQNITSEDLQEIWGKILANEINSPGNFSLRTLDILSNLSREEALKFRDFCSMANQFGDVVQTSGGDLEPYGFTLDDLLLLGEAGLVNSPNPIGVKYKTYPIMLDQERMAFNLILHNRGFIIYKPNILEYTFSAYSLTRSGIELMKVIPAKLSDLYYEDLRKMLESSKYIVHETRLAARIIDKKGGQTA